ncbi:MAG: AAA family ATPase [Pyrinomonadaceae bacterium]
MLALLERERPRYKVKVRETERMIKSLKIENFRGFESLELNNLSKVNVIVGDNASGKTALLEALFLLGGLSSEMFLRLKSFRIMPEVKIDTTQQTFSELFGDYFYQFDTSKTIYLETKGSLAETRNVKMFFAEMEAAQIEVGNSIEETQLISPFNFKGKYEGTKEFEVQAKIEDGTLKLPRFPSPVKAAFFASNTKFHPQETADRFSHLDAEGTLQEVTKIFYDIYPFVKDLSIVTRNGQGMVWGRMQGLKTKQPLTLISEGVNKLLQLLLAIKATPYSYILIDEIENGFYYERLPDICRAIYELAVKSNVQLFISTHSKELLEDIIEVANKNERDFSLIRTEMTKNGSTAIHFSGLTFKRSIEQRAEIR